MKDPFIFIVAALVAVMTVWSGYGPWVKPEEWLRRQEEYYVKVLSKNPNPIQKGSISYWSQHPVFEMWLSRIVSVFILTICIVMAYQTW
jgi:hypothetical protein